MPDHARAEVEAFIRGICGDVPVVFDRTSGPTPAGIHCILIGITPDLSARNDRHQPLRVERRYLLHAPDEADGAARLEAILFHALEGRSRFVIEPEAPPYELWRALGLPPQPGLVLRVPVVRPRPAVKRTPVETVDIQLAPIETTPGARAGAAPGSPTVDFTVQED